MTISEIKAKLGVQSLPFSEGLEIAGKVSDWGTIWDDTIRRQVSILKVDLTAIMADPTRGDLYLAFTQPTSTTSGKVFDSYRIGIDKAIIGVL